MAIGKKKKVKEDIAVESYPTKFKFDDNFSHGIAVEAQILIPRGPLLQHLSFPVKPFWVALVLVLPSLATL